MEELYTTRLAIIRRLNLGGTLATRISARHIGLLQRLATTRMRAVDHGDLKHVLQGEKPWRLDHRALFLCLNLSYEAMSASGQKREAL